MNDSETTLRAALSALAQDAPTAARVLSTAERGYRRRLQHRRWAAAVGAAVVVVATVAATTLVRPWAAGPSGRETPVVISTVTPSTEPVTTLGTRAAPATTPLAANSRLVPFTGVTIASPVSVPASSVPFDDNGPDVTTTPTSLMVDWSGLAPTAVQTVDDASGATGTGQYRGYLITAVEPSGTVSAGAETATTASESITVNGHAARLLTGPKGSFDDTYASPTEARVVWQLPDHRWISVWAVGEDRGVLIGFASAITNQTTEFPAAVSPGLTVQGYTAVSRTDSPFVSQMNGPGLTLCRPAAATTAAGTPVSSAAQSSASVAPDPDSCLTVYVEVADGGFGAGIVMGNESNAKFVADSVGVDVGGVKVQVNAEYQAAWTRWGQSTIVVQAPAGVQLATADLAALAASVQVAPSLGVRNEPNALVESSLAEQSRAEAAERSQNGSAPTR